MPRIEKYLAPFQLRPDGMTAPDYLEWIAGYGLAPSLSLFSSTFDDTVVDMKAEVERAKAFAEVQAELGLDRTMVSSMSVPERRARPAVGAAFDEGRLNRVIDNLSVIGETLRGTYRVLSVHRQHAVLLVGLPWASPS